MKTGMICSGVVLAAVLYLSFGSGMVLAETGTGAPEGEITIKGKKPARFSHNVHIDMGLSCAVCHHDQNHKPRTAEEIGALTDTAELKCVTCHNSEFLNPDLRKAKDVFHARCKTCHKEGYQGKKGPKKCSDCHLKKKKAYEGC